MIQLPPIPIDTNNEFQQVWFMEQVRRAIIELQQAYTVSIGAGLLTTFSDGATTYFGGFPSAPPASTGGQRRVYLPKSGTITNVFIFSLCLTVAGSSEAWPLYLRVNNSTDTLIQTVSSANAHRLWSNTNLSIPVQAGDYFEIKSVAPTWATNPVDGYFSGIVFVE